MRILIFLKPALTTSILTLLISPPLFAKSPSEVFSIKVKPKVDRCVGDTKTHSADCSKSAEGSKIEDLKISLSTCDDKNSMGKNCSGTWEKDLEIDGAKFHFVLRVGHFENAKFKYLLMLQICHFELSGENCPREMIFLKDVNVPYLSSLIGPRIWKSDYRGGGGYDSAILYNTELEVGDGSGTGL